MKAELINLRSPESLLFWECDKIFSLYQYRICKDIEEFIKSKEPPHEKKVAKSILADKMRDYHEKARQEILKLLQEV